MVPELGLDCRHAQFVAWQIQVTVLRIVLIIDGQLREETEMEGKAEEINATVKVVMNLKGRWLGRSLILDLPLLTLVIVKDQCRGLVC